MKLTFVVALFLLSLTACSARLSGRSSHSEAPGTARSPVSDISDIYAFQSYEAGRSGYTVLIMNAYGLQNPIGGPNYFTLSDDHFYEIYVDNNGDAKEDLTFQFYFGSSLGGIVTSFLEYPSDVCNQTQQTPYTVNKQGGLTLPIGTGANQKNIPVALKFIGKFTAADTSLLNWFETYQINLVTGDRTTGVRQAITQANTSPANGVFKKPFDNAGQKTFGSNYEAYASSYRYEINIPGCGTTGRVFVGQRSEPFSVNLGKIFDLVNFVPASTLAGGIGQCASNNVLAGSNVDSLILEIPTSCLVAPGKGGVIGVWGGIRMLQDTGVSHVPGAQLSRLGNPLVNELVIGLRDKDIFSRGTPSGDGYFLDYVTNPTFPEILNILFLGAVKDILNDQSISTLAPTNIPRMDLVTNFLTGIPGLNQIPGFTACEYMRLNTSITPTPQGSQNSMGVIAGDNAGYPNGRRPGDDVIDITLRVAMGVLCTLNISCTPSQAPFGSVPWTDGAPSSDGNFYNAFPFLQTPNPGSFSDSTPTTCKYCTATGAGNQVCFSSATRVQVGFVLSILALVLCLLF